MKMRVEYYDDENYIKERIKKCEGEHIQQVVYSSYHNALTQICFTCEVVRTTLSMKEIQKSRKKAGGGEN